MLMAKNRLLKFHSFVTLLSFFLLCSIARGQEEPLRIDFSKSTPQENGFQVRGPGFDAYPKADIVFGAVPTDNAFSDATDGRGVTVTCDPGEGIMLVGDAVHTTNAALVRCSVRTNAPHAAVTIAALDAGENQFISTNSPGNGDFFVGRYKRISCFFVPPSTGFRPILQALNTSESQPLTLYIDNLDVFLLDSMQYYHAQFLDGDEYDPDSISLSDAGAATGGSDFESISVSPPVANIDIGEHLSIYCDYVVDGDGKIHWTVQNNESLSVDQYGFVTGLSGGHGWVSALFGELTDRALVFVNPIPAEHNDRAYEWYQSQMGSGPATYNNCGPACTQMAIHWHSASNVPVKTIRENRPRDGGWWANYDVTITLDDYKIPYAVRPVQSPEDIRECLNRGNIVILLGEMKHISYGRDAHYGRYYELGSGHFFIIKGRSLDGQYFVVYDPNSFWNDYDDAGVMLGRNRLYRCDEVYECIENWWPNCIEIGAVDSNGTLNVLSASAGPGGAEREKNDQ